MITELRQQLADLESRQHALGGAATDWLSTPKPTDPGLTDGSTDGSTDGPTEPGPTGPDLDPTGPVGSVGADGGEGADPDARLAPTVSLLTQVIEAWRAPLSSCAEDDLLEAVDRLGALQQAKEAMLLRVVTELESRGVPSPAGSPGSTGSAHWTRP